MASLVYLFSAGGSVTPYVLAGVGYYNGKVTVPSLNIDESDSKVGFGGGGGIRFPMGSAALFAEVRYMNISTDPSTTYLPIIVGVSFGGK
jgi:opacity protein-like surface antigen